MKIVFVDSKYLKLLKEKDHRKNNLNYNCDGNFSKSTITYRVWSVREKLHYPPPTRGANAMPTPEAKSPLTQCWQDLQHVGTDPEHGLQVGILRLSSYLYILTCIKRLSITPLY